MAKQALVLIFVWCVAAHCAEPAPQLNPAQKTGEMPDVINESSGVVRSRRFADKDVFWTHNDSGDSARIFAISSAGAVLGEVAVDHAVNRDWEEISMDDSGRLIVCDIGDNARTHADFTLYRIDEPALNAAKSSPAQAFHYRYPKGEGPYDAEGLFVCGAFAYLFTKDINGVRLYQLPLPEKPPVDEAPVEAKFIAESTTLATITGAALSRDGRHIALVTYLSTMVIDLAEPFADFARSEEKLKTLLTLPKRVRMGMLGQTEGVCFDGNDLVLTTESGVDLKIKGVGKVYRIKDAIGVTATAAAPAAFEKVLGDWSGKWVDNWQYKGQGGSLSCTLSAAEGNEVKAVFTAPGFLREPVTLKMKIKADGADFSTSGALDMGKPAGMMTFTIKISGDTLKGDYESPEERGSFELSRP